MRLTNKSVAALDTPAGGAAYVYDAELSGFGVRCSPGGKKAYFVQYRVKGQRSRRKTLGAANIMSADVARQSAREFLARVTLEGDTPAQPKREVMTLDQAFDAYKAGHLARRSQSYRNLADNIWKLHVPKKLKVKKVDELTRRELLAIPDTLIASGKNATAKLALAIIKAMFNWLVDRDELNANPLTKAKAKVNLPPRERVLDDDELKKVWNTAAALSEPEFLAFRLLIQTTCRKNEILELRRNEVQRDRLVLTAARVKNRTEHRVPLPANLKLAMTKHLKSTKGDLVFDIKPDSTRYDGLPSTRRTHRACHLRHLGTRGELQLRRGLRIELHDLGLGGGILDSHRLNSVG